MDLKTKYLEIELKNPIVPSASPLSKNIDNMKRLEDSGASAIVMFSLFEEQIRHENESFDFMMEQGTERFPESLSYFPEVEDYHVGPDQYLDLIRRASASCEVPIIGSLNGSSPGGWSSFARSMQDAGAAAIELNIYLVPGNPHTSGRDVEDRHVEILRQVKDAVSVPVAVKLSPFFSAPGEMALSLVAEGADGFRLASYGADGARAVLGPEGQVVGEAGAEPVAVARRRDELRSKRDSPWIGASTWCARLSMRPHCRSSS